MIRPLGSLSGVLLILALPCSAQSTMEGRDLANFNSCLSVSPDPKVLGACGSDCTRAYDVISLRKAWQFLDTAQMPLTLPIRVGIIDSGIDRKHPEFIGVSIRPVDLFSPPPIPIAKPIFEHGTSVAGIIGANDVGASSCSTTDAIRSGYQTTGILSGSLNTNNQYYLDAVGDASIVIVFGLLPYIDRLAADGIKLVNISSGYSSSQLLFQQYYAALLSKIRQYPNVLFVVAAGENNLPVSKVIPAAFGAEKNVIVVGATEFDDSRSVVGGASNYSDPVAPASFPVNISAPRSVWTPAPNRSWQYFTGTSASAPMVTGTAAFLQALKPEWTPAQVKAAVIASADAIKDQSIGGKRLNVCRAVKGAVNTGDPPASQLLSPTNNAVIPLNTSTTSGPAWIVFFNWSDVSPTACNALIGYEVAVSVNGQPVGGGSVQAPGFNLTITNPASLTGWTWSVTAVDPFGNRTPSATGTFSLQAPPPPPPTCMLSASPTTITTGQSSTLTWTTFNNPTSGVINPAIPGFNFTSGQASVSPTATTTYTLTVQNTGGTNTCQAMVTVNPGGFSQVSFSRNDIALAGNPLSIASADFNGDGKPDLVVTTLTNSGASPGTISIFLGNGDGTFTFKTSFTTGSTSTVWVAAGDFNGDGKPDLAVANGFSRSISIFLGNGDGTFGPQTDLPMPGRTESVIAADFNQDGKLDIAAPNFEPTPYTVSIFLGNGNGTFGLRNDFPTLNVPFVVIADDLNADGKLDLAINSGVSGGVSVLLGNGDGTFQPRIDSPTGFSTSSGVCAGDFNGDGKPDLAVPNNGDNSISVLLGNGDGTFNLLAPIPTDLTPSRCVTGDFNADGKLDLAVAIHNAAEVSLFLGNGDGTFQTVKNLPTTAGPQFIIAGDFNGDGKLDLISANYESMTITVLLNTSH